MLEEEGMRNNFSQLFYANSPRSETNISKGLAPFAGTWGTRIHNMPKPWNSSLLAPSSLLFLMRYSQREERGKGEFPHQTEPPQLSLLELRGRIRAWLSRVLWFMDVLPRVWGRDSSGSIMPGAPLACTDFPTGVTWLPKKSRSSEEHQGALCEPSFPDGLWVKLKM